MILLQFGIDGLENYRALILIEHPEYWSEKMLDNLEDYLNKGGRLLYLGGNGIYDAVDVSDDFTYITVYGRDGQGRTRLFRQLTPPRPESRILGVAFPWTPDGGDIGNNAYERKAYKVEKPDHRFFKGTGLKAGDLIGEYCWCNFEGQTAGSGASGWECDRIDENSPENIELLAIGENSGAQANMTYYDHPGGGFVFSVGSMSFGGSLVVDEKLQQIVRNILEECLE
jgi:hypothetical protein